MLAQRFSDCLQMSQIIEIAFTSVVLQWVVQDEDLILGVKARQSVILGAGCAFKLQDTR